MVKSNQELQSKHGPLAEPLPRQLYVTVTATLAHPTRQVPFQTRTLKRRIGSAARARTGPTICGLDLCAAS